jgi:hypothetical protein
MDLGRTSGLEDGITDSDWLRQWRRPARGWHPAISKKMSRGDDGLKTESAIIFCRPDSNHDIQRFDNCGLEARRNNREERHLRLLRLKCRVLASCEITGRCTVVPRGEVPGSLARNTRQEGMNECALAACQPSKQTRNRIR